jgi:WD40 repeat protein
MRRTWCLSVFALALAWPAAFPTWATAQEEEDDREPLGKFTVALDAGGHTGPTTFLQFTADGEHLITGSTDRTVRLWDVETGQTLRVLRPPGYSCVIMAASPDGQRLAVMSEDIRRERGKQVVTTSVVYLVAVADGRIERVLKDHTAPITSLAFSPDGKKLASGGHDNTIRIWDVATGRADLVLHKTGHVAGLAFAPDGRHLAQQTFQGQCIIRDLGNPDAMFQVKATRRPVLRNANVAWSADGKTVAACGDDGLRLYNPDGKLRLHLLQNHETASVGISLDSSRVLATWNDGQPHATVFDIQSGKEVVVFSPKGTTSMQHGALSPDGTRAATVDGSQAITLWNTADGVVVKRFGATSWLVRPDSQAGWSADGRNVAWRTVPDPKAWTGGPTTFNLGELHFEPPLASRQFRGAVSQHGSLSLKRVNPHTAELSIGEGKKAKKHALKMEPMELSSLTLVGSNRAALAGGPWIHVYDTANPRTPRKLRHEAPVVSIAPSQDGRYLLALSEDQKLRIWDPDRNNPLLTVYVSGRDWIAWTEAGYYAATPGGERLMGWVVDNGPNQLGTFYPAQRFRKTLHRPDVIPLLLEKGYLKAALAKANEERKKEGEQVAEAAADLEQLLPPQATLAIIDDKNLPKVKLKATAQAAAKGQPVTSLQLRVDGRPLPEGQGVIDLKAGQEKAEAEWEVELPPGEHELKVQAHSRDVAGFSPAVPISVPVAASDQPTLHLIAVGINDYRGSLHLNCAVDDARGLVTAFPRCCAGKSNLFGEAKVKPLLDKAATRQAILDALKASHQAVKPGDLLVFSFAGHGIKQGKKFYLLTHDTDPENVAGTGLSGEDLRAALVDMPCQVLLLLDACHSAAGVRAFIDEAARGLTDDSCGVAVLCAAMGHEEAQEKEGHGLFTKAVLDALAQSNGVPFNPRNRRQYVHHLGAFVLDYVQEESKDTQHPFLTMPFVTESFPIRQLPTGSPGGK